MGKKIEREPVTSYNNMLDMLEPNPFIDFLYYAGYFLCKNIYKYVLTCINIYKHI